MNSGDLTLALCIAWFAVNVMRFGYGFILGRIARRQITDTVSRMRRNLPRRKSPGTPRGAWRFDPQALLRYLEGGRG